MKEGTEKPVSDPSSVLCKQPKSCRKLLAERGLKTKLEVDFATLIRVDKTGSLGPWSRVIVYCSKLSFCQNDSPIKEGPKDPVLPTLLTYRFH